MKSIVLGIFTLILSGSFGFQFGNSVGIYNIEKSETDPGYRVGVASTSHEVQLPSHNTDWELEYKFKVPPIPTDKWNDSEQTIYTYGQVDFDWYGAHGKDSISKYYNNQIVPQVMIGKCLDSNDKKFTPHFHVFDRWVMQTQYFWRDEANPKGYSLCGNLINVSPDDEITENISYNSSTGQITASISSLAGTSSITIDKPFPNEDELFGSWSDFFMKAENKSKTPGPYSKPIMNVETHFCIQETVCSILPFNVYNILIPGIEWEKSDYKVYSTGKFECPDGLASELAILHFNE